MAEQWTKALTMFLIACMALGIVWALLTALRKMWGRDGRDIPRRG
jgi:hypothetical protein